MILVAQFGEMSNISSFSSDGLKVQETGFISQGKAREKLAENRSILCVLGFTRVITWATAVFANAKVLSCFEQVIHTAHGRTQERSSNAFVRSNCDALRFSAT